MNTAIQVLQSEIEHVEHAMTRIDIHEHEDEWNTAVKRVEELKSAIGILKSMDKELHEVLIPQPDSLQCRGITLNSDEIQRLIIGILDTEEKRQAANKSPTNQFPSCDPANKALIKRLKDLQKP